MFYKTFTSLNTNFVTYFLYLTRIGSIAYLRLPSSLYEKSIGTKAVFLHAVIDQISSHASSFFGLETFVSVIAKDVQSGVAILCAKAYAVNNVSC